MESKLIRTLIVAGAVACLLQAQEPAAVRRSRPAGAKHTAGSARHFARFGPEAQRNADVSWDTGGNSMLNGRYYVRQVLLTVANTGTVTRARSLSGIMTADGAGGYGISGQLLDSSDASGQPKALSVTGLHYGVQPNGTAFLENPMFPGDQTNSVNGGVGQGVFVGSSTEGSYQDLLIAIPLGSTAATNARLTGTYWIGVLDFARASSTQAKNALFKVNSSGTGSFGNVAITGRAANQGSNALTQTSNGASYTFAADGSGTATFPLPAGVTADNALFAGTKTIYVSADGNFVLGGTPAGYDIFVGIHNLSSPATDATYKGVYYNAGLDVDDDDLTQPYIYSFYGSINALGNGTQLWHSRQLPDDEPVFDNMYDSETPIAADGTQDKDYFRYALGVGGNALIITGNATDYSLMLGVQAPTVTPTGVFISPTGVLNAGSFSPITAAIAPGELITIFGQNLAATPQVVQAPPFPTTEGLGGVQVTVNGRFAAVYAVSPTQVSAIVPYATSESLARVQVINNGTASNAVTLYTGLCTPGIFAIPPVGTGYGAVLHADFSIVTTAKPAHPGETVLIYLTGLGAVSPAVADGAPGPITPFSYTTNDFVVWFGNRQGTVSYQGLAPTLAGLYQLNARIPNDAATGDVYIGVSGPGCYAEQVVIPVAQ